MKSIIGMIFLVTLMFVFAGCSKDKNVQETPNLPPSNTNSTIATGGEQVTFLELGSVNCIPCRMMQPVMKEIEMAYTGKVKVVFIDVMQQFGIRAIPTQVFLDSQGKEMARHTGFFPKDSIVALLAGKGVQ